MNLNECMKPSENFLKLLSGRVVTSPGSVGVRDLDPGIGIVIATGEEAEGVDHVRGKKKRLGKSFCFWFAFFFSGDSFFLIAVSNP